MFLTAASRRSSLPALGVSMAMLAAQNTGANA